MKKQVLSIILSVCMLCSLLPTTAFAASCEVSDCNHVAAIGDKYFDSVQAAVDALDMHDADYSLIEQYIEEYSKKDLSQITADSMSDAERSPIMAAMP